MKNIFEKRPFKLWGYTISHKYLLFRSEKQYDDIDYPSKYKPNSTLDIEFWGVAYMNIPTHFNTLTINHNKEYDGKEFNGLSNNEDLKYFDLYDGEDKYCIIAAGCIIGQSNWYEKSRLRNPELEYEKIILKI